MKPFFSIIIPTLNEEKYLPLLLDDLSKQSYREFEVIHIDAQSEDKTLAVAKKFSQKFNLKQFTLKERNVSLQRNYGAKKANGQWLIFMDADNRLPPYFLLGLKYQLEKGQVLGKKPIELFTTLIHLNDEETNNPLNRSIVNFINVAIKTASKTNRPEAFGAMIGIKKEVFMPIQFNEKSKVMEDCLLVQNAVNQGHYFVALSDPTYAYSLRRFHAKGLPQTAYSGLRMQLKRLLGSDFSDGDDCGYTMGGGGQYR